MGQMKQREESNALARRPHCIAPLRPSPSPPPLQVMRAWAKAEFERDNVGNARILLAEALRRSPGVQPLYVLAGNVELTAGNLGVCVCVCVCVCVDWNQGREPRQGTKMDVWMRMGREGHSE